MQHSSGRACSHRSNPLAADATRRDLPLFSDRRPRPFRRMAGRARYPTEAIRTRSRRAGAGRGARLRRNQFNPEQAFGLGRHVGFQCHIEMTRPMVESWCASADDELPPQSTGAIQSKVDIFEDVDARLATLSRVADDVYAHWARGLAH